MGLAFGIVSVLWLGFIFNDTVIEITLTLAVSYVAYFTVCIYPYLSIIVYFWSLHLKNLKVKLNYIAIHLISSYEVFN